MAGEKLSYAEMKSWYDAFNEVITNYGGEIATLTPPAQGAKAQPSDVNNIFNKIDEFFDDEYLGTQPTLYNADYSIIQSGTKMIRSTTTPISETATNIAQIKCRNKITYSSGSNSNGAHDNGENSNRQCLKGSYSSGSNGNGSNTRNANQYGSCTCGTRTNGTRTNGYYGDGTKSNVAYTNGENSSGTLIDILNANTSY